MCINGTWGTICSHFWNNDDASVICRQLGYSPYGMISNVNYTHCITIGAVASSGYYSNSIWPHNIIDLNCTGNESNFLNCSQNGLVDHSCPNSADASIACQSQYFTICQIIHFC